MSAKLEKMIYFCVQTLLRHFLDPSLLLFFFFKGSPIMMWMKFTRSMPLWICHYGSLAKLRPHIRNVSQGSSYLDSRIHSIQPLCCRSPLLAGHASITLTVGLQPRRTITTDRPSWYESVADSTPVYLTEQLLNSSQQMTGLPWWASIMCTTLALRTAITLPLGIYQSIIIAKVLLDTYMDICLCKIVFALVLLLFFSYIQPFKSLGVVRFLKEVSYAHQGSINNQIPEMLGCFFYIYIYIK